MATKETLLDAACAVICLLNLLSAQDQLGEGKKDVH
jgi:hypothetical protein